VIIVGGFQFAARQQGAVPEYPAYSWFRPIGFPLSLSIMVFSFAGLETLPSILEVMRQPTRGPSVVSSSYIFITANYVLIAVYAYYFYGNALPNTDILTAMSQLSNVGRVTLVAAKIVLAVHVVMVFPTTFNPTVLYVEAFFKIEYIPNPTGRFIVRSAERIVVLFAMALTAALIPYFNDVIGLVSNLSTSFNLFVWPIVSWWLLRRPSFYEEDEARLRAKRKPIPLDAELTHGDIGVLHYALMLVIFVVAVAGAGTGLYFSTLQLASDVKAGGNPFKHFFKK